MHKPKILFDMDGTTYDFQSELYKRIQQDTSLPVKVRHTLSDLDNRTKIALRKIFDPQEFDHLLLEKKIKSLYQTSEFFTSIKLYPGMRDLLHELDKNYYVKILTKPADNAIAQSESAKRFAIHRDLGEKFNKRLITTHEKNEVRGDINFDDAKYIAGNDIPEWTQIFVDQPHNRGIPGPRVYHNDLERWKTIIPEVLEQRRHTKIDEHRGEIRHTPLHCE